MTSVENREYWPEEWPAWPESSRARRVVHSSFELGLYFLDAPIFLRKMRLEATDERARNRLAEMGGWEREQASQLVDLWERNALIQQNIRYEEEKKGIGVVNHLLPKWHAAGAEVRRAEDEALELGPAAHGYFQSRLERFRILQEDRDEVGQYKMIPDYSELRRQWYSREPITEPRPWPWDQMLALCKRFEARGSKTKEWSVGLKLTIAAIVLTIVFGVAGIVATVIMDRF